MSHENTNEKDSKHVAGTRYLSFSLGTEEYAIPLLSVKEVIALPEITRVPFTPAQFLGITNLRGQVISVIDLRIKFSIRSNDSSETAVIICDLAHHSLGVVVDSINSVLSPMETEISEKPTIQSNINTEYITGVYRRKKNLVLLLDIMKALDIQELKALENTRNSVKNAA